MGKREYRDIDGVLILDKPPGISSNQALQQARRLYRARKAGHCGSLDPLATGLLPVCFGQATRFSGYLLDAAKGYRATLRLGQTTATGDAEGEILEQRPVRVDRALLDESLAGFVGEIDQVPPMYSALKHEGRRLYQLAREGLEVERKARRVRIERLEVIEFESPRLEVDVYCSKGTYVRTLAEDIGEALGCGAHLAGLRRLSVGGFVLEQAMTLDELALLDDAARDRALISPAELMPGYPEIELDADDSRDMRHGKRLQLSASRAPGYYRLRDAENAFLGLGEVVEGGWLKAKRLMNTSI